MSYILITDLTWIETTHRHETIFKTETEGVALRIEISKDPPNDVVLCTQLKPGYRKKDIQLYHDFNNFDIDLDNRIILYEKAINNIMPTITNYLKTINDVRILLTYKKCPK